MVKSTDCMQPKTDSVALLDAVEARPVPATPKKIGFVSLGCPKNLVDSEVMMGLLAQGGAQSLPAQKMPTSSW